MTDISKLMEVGITEEAALHLGETFITGFATSNGSPGNLITATITLVSIIMPNYGHVQLPRIESSPREILVIGGPVDANPAAYGLYLNPQSGENINGAPGIRGVPKKLDTFTGTYSVSAVLYKVGASDWVLVS